MATGLAAGSGPSAGAGTVPAFGTFVSVATNAIPDTASRQALARRYGLVILRGTIKPGLVTDLRQARPGIKLIAYDQSAGLSSSEVTTVQQSHPEWLARDCSGNLIHPRGIPGTTLADLTNAGFRSWESQQVAAKVATGTDGSFLDTLGAYFPPDFYTGRPCTGGVPVTDAAWRDGSANLLTLVRQATARTVIANGFGLGSGAAYYANAADSDVLINAADGVQIEGFTRWATTPVTSYYRDGRWKQDITFLRLLGSRGKMALAYTKVGVSATPAQLTQLRDYAVGTFLEGFVPGNAWFGFADTTSSVPTVTSSPDWARALGFPKGRATIGATVVRGFDGGTLTMQVATAPRVTP